MLVADFIRTCISDPDALSDAGIAASRDRLSATHDTLRQARATLAAAEKAVSELDGRQGALSARIEELRRKLADKRPLIGITKGKPEALATAARRHAETQRDYDFALLALEILISGERLPAALDLKRAELAIMQAERAWMHAKGEELTRTLWRPIAQAAGFDASIEITLPGDTQIASVVRDLGIRDTAIEELQADIVRDADFMLMQQRAAGLIF